MKTFIPFIDEQLVNKPTHHITIIGLSNSFKSGLAFNIISEMRNNGQAETVMFIVEEEAKTVTARIAKGFRNTIDQYKGTDICVTERNLDFYEFIPKHKPNVIVIDWFLMFNHNLDDLRKLSNFCKENNITLITIHALSSIRPGLLAGAPCINPEKITNDQSLLIETKRNSGSDLITLTIENCSKIFEVDKNTLTIRELATCVQKPPHLNIKLALDELEELLKHKPTLMTTGDGIEVVTYLVSDNPLPTIRNVHKLLKQLE